MKAVLRYNRDNLRRQVFSVAFKENAYQQLSITDSFTGLTAREQRALEKSWAKIFADELFPAIDEKRFSVLYSEQASRPNTPVNVIVGALIIKEMFDYSDDEMVENLMLDLHLQYALHTTSSEEQPLSDKTLSRFRKRCYDYETLHNEDLYHDCVKDLSATIAKIMGIKGRVRRMDSMMIESNIRKLSRMELLYTCISKLVMLINKKDASRIPEQLKHYADPNDFNQVIYHQRSTDTDDRMQQLLNDADSLLSLCGNSYEDATGVELFIRCLSEQTIVEDNEEGNKVIRCPAGHEPKSCTYMAPSKQCQVSFNRELCVGCPYQDKCHPKIFKHVAKIITSKAAHDRAVIQRTMHSEEFKNYARLRNGVETIPSIIRNNYHLENMPRGKQRGNFFFGCKIIALNFKKLFNYRKGLGHYAPNPVIV